VRKIPLALALLAARPAAAANPPDFLRAGIAAAADKLAKEVLDRRRPLSVRDLPEGALAELALGRGPVRAEMYLDALFDTQDMGPNSPGYGTVPWQIRGKPVTDANAIEFAMLPTAVVFSRYATGLDRGYYGRAAPHLKAALAALERHDVKVSYTNIYLMKTVNLILLGQITLDDAALAAGEKMLDDWLAYTRSNGIGEYDSPTYDKVDANDLDMGLLYAEKPATKAKFRAALDYLWTDISANYFPGRRSLSGPHSRDYDFLEGRGGIDVFFAVYGWNPPPDKLVELDLESAALLQSELDGGYRPPESLRALRERPQRWVLSRWGPETGQDRANFVTADFAIGAASRDSGPQDKSVSIQLAAPGRFADITVVADDSGEPYGKKKVEGRDGHSKPKHLPSRPVAVQDRGLLLATFDVGADKKRPSRFLETNVILPLAADELAVDGEAVALSAPNELALDESSVVSVRDGNALALVRVLAATACRGETARLTLAADRAGLKYGAARLIVAHHDAGRGDAPGDCRGRTAILFEALTASSDSERRAAIEAFRNAKHREQSASGEASVEAEVGGRRLALSRDLGQKTILSRTVDGEPMSFDPLSVDGVPVVLGGSSGPTAP
jgi:hypothetical protein